MLLAAEPGMGRSKFLSYTQQNINKYNPGIWVLRINLLENVHTLQTIETERPNEWEQFLRKTAHVTEQNYLPLVKLLFPQEGNATVILDGYDEICPDYSTKVDWLMQRITNENTIKLWVSF
jgi:hypothetical protein